MKLTPIDIHHKEFHRAIRGYNEEEVDKFLDEVAEEFERLFKDNIELKEQIEKAKQDMENYLSMEKTLHNTLIAAQRTAEDTTSSAQREAEQVIEDAEHRAQEIIEEAQDLKRKYEANLDHLKRAEEEFRGKFKSMLESYMRIADSTAVLADIADNAIAEDTSMPYISMEESIEVTVFEEDDFGAQYTAGAGSTSDNVDMTEHVTTHGRNAVASEHMVDETFLPEPLNDDSGFRWSNDDDDSHWTALSDDSKSMGDDEIEELSSTHISDNRREKSTKKEKAEEFDLDSLAY